MPVFGELRVIIDGPVLEVSSVGGIFGARINPAGDSLTISAPGETAIHPLR